MVALADLRRFIHTGREVPHGESDTGRRPDNRSQIGGSLVSPGLASQRDRYRAILSASHPRTQSEASGLWAKPQGDVLGDDVSKAAGREEPRGPRALESPVLVSVVGECDRVPLRKGVWRVGALGRDATTLSSLSRKRKSQHST